MVWGDALYSDHIYVPGMESGTYTVSATDQCPKTVSMDIHVDDGCQVIIPNVITPNGCLLYTSDAADARSSVDLGSRRIIKKTLICDTHINLVTPILCILKEPHNQM